MKASLILAAAVFAFSGMDKCRACLGMTAKEVEAVFAKPISSRVEDGNQKVLYHFGEFDVIVTYENGTSVSEWLRSRKKGATLADAGCVAMAALLSGEVESRWQQPSGPADEGRTSWHVGDAYSAMRSREAGEADALVVQYGIDKDDIASKLKLCQVQLGKTVADFEAKYGKPLDSRTDSENALPEYMYRYEGQLIMVGFSNNAAVLATFPSIRKNTRLSARLCLAVARAITGAANWKEDRKSPGISDGKRFWDSGSDFSIVRTNSKTQGDAITVVNERVLGLHKGRKSTGSTQSPAATGDAKN